MSRLLNRQPFRFRLRHGAGVLILVLVGVWANSTGRLTCLKPGREARLACAINSNVGYAEMTRGMNSYTIAALNKEATDADIPLLQKMLYNKDDVTAMTAAEVLKTRGDQGHAALLAAYMQAKKMKNSTLAGLINEHGDLHQKYY